MNPNKTLFLALQLICCSLFGQQGLISGSVVNGSKKAVKDATVSCIPLNDTMATQTMATDKLGQFAFSGLNDGYHRLVITHAAYGRRVVDSIHIRKDRNSFHLDELVLPDKLVREEEVTVYAEKPLIEMTRDGKIVFNTGESAGAQTASATDLLKSTPLVSVDPNGNVLLKGKEVKVLIDEKPVELNARELQELLESMQGSNIEKIEVMTNPPPQYANERGGVINIVTKKGKTGLTLRASMYYGTRGEWGGNLTAGYKKNKTSVQLSSGFGRGIFTGESSSLRQNFYTDSANRFNTGSEYENLGDRPSYRLQFNYDPNKRNQFSTTVQWNRNRTDNQSLATYTNINRFNLPWRISERNIQTNGLNNGLNVSASYTAKDKPQTGVFRAIAGVFSGDNYSDRDFFQVFFDGQKIPTGVDSTQEQVTRLYNRNFTLRLSYDKSVDSARWQFSTGINVFSNNSDNHLKTRFLKKPEYYFVESGPLSNDFGFHQRIYAARFSVRYRLQRDWHITSGIQAEQTRTWFNNEELAGNYDNRYISWLPFTNTVWKPDTRYTVSFSYRKSIQRPGVNALNPAIDYSDPYNTRFGNPYLKPSFSHNFDWVLNRWHKDYFWNISAGYNKLSELFNALRELLPDGRTQITWKNISSRQEYEISAWGGITYAKNSRINISAGYVYNTYSENDKRLLKYRDGGSFTSGINGTYSLGAYWQFSGIFTYNRFANPQGTVRSNLNLNLGAQRKLVKNRLVVSLNIIDPFSGQVTRTASFGTNFQVESSSFTQTRNIKLGISYNFIKPPPAKKPVAKKPVAAKPAK